jgi:ribosomal protein S18 acetylase RimI-like enzyme
MISPSIQLREANAIDSAAIAKLAVEFSKLNPSPAGGPANDLAGADESILRIINEPYLHLIVAESDARVVAVMAFSKISSIVHADSSTIFIDLLVVEEGYRRMGIGSALVNHAINFASKSDAYKVLVVTRADNLPARALYNKMHFSKNGVALALYGV